MTSVATITLLIQPLEKQKWQNLFLVILGFCLLYFISSYICFVTTKVRMIEFDVSKVDVSFKSKAGTIDVCQNGAGIDFSEEKAKEILLEKEIEIIIGLGDGEGCALAWGCDLTYEYVKINGDYRT